MWPFSRGIGGSRGGDLGSRGEALARRFLKHRGLKILARNYRTPTGEVDLIALDTSTRKDLGAETVVFVEVKTRATDTHSAPESAVHAAKQRRLRKAAKHYLARHDIADRNVRFDVVSVVLGDDNTPRIHHIPDAF